MNKERNALKFLEKKKERIEFKIIMKYVES